MSFTQKLVLICAGLVAFSALFRLPLNEKRKKENASTGEDVKLLETPKAKKKKHGMRAVGIVLAILLFCGAIFMGGRSLMKIYADAGEIKTPVTAEFVRSATAEEEGYDEDNTVCRVEYTSEKTDSVLAVSYTYEEWSELPEGHSLTGYIYTSDALGVSAVFTEKKDEKTVIGGLRESMTDREAMHLDIALALVLVAIGTVIMTCGWSFYSTYEKIWFLTILALAAVFGIIFPEEDCNGINGVVIVALYLADTLLNIWCELLISKQSKWNFIVSIFVELAEIGICVLLRYRFATMATTLFFWLPIDIISFVNWHRHPDKKEDELTVVRTLKGWQEALVLLGIAVWTFGIGYLVTRMDIGTDLFNNRTLATLVIYLDACASAVGVANGLFILFRFREQWVAWITCAILEAIINILSGQYILLVLKAGYVTNSLYGYIKWTKYIRKAEKQVAVKG